MGLCFDDLVEGDVFEFGTADLSDADVELFHQRFAPRLPASAEEPPDRRAAAQAHVYALWSRMLYEFTRDWPVLARIGQDQLRWYKSARAGDRLTVRITIMTAAPLDERRGLVLTQHDVLNQEGELVMALLTRTVLARR